MTNKERRRREKIKQLTTDDLYDPGVYSYPLLNKCYSDPAFAVCLTWRAYGRNGLSAVALAGILGREQEIPEVFKELCANPYLKRFFCSGTRLPLFQRSLNIAWSPTGSQYRLIKSRGYVSEQTLEGEKKLLAKVRKLSNIDEETARKWGGWSVRKHVWNKLKRLAALVSEGEGK